MMIESTWACWDYKHFNRQCLLFHRICTTFHARWIHYHNPKPTPAGQTKRKLFICKKSYSNSFLGFLWCGVCELPGKRPENHEKHLHLTKYKMLFHQDNTSAHRSHYYFTRCPIFSKVFLLKIVTCVCRIVWFKKNSRCMLVKRKVLTLFVSFVLLKMWLSIFLI